MPSYQFLAVARIQFRQRDIVYFGKQDIVYETTITQSAWRRLFWPVL
ncbi:Uncharacterised protein [Escherichia coli]|nr:Uncharacterised protein [Escherichia coli]